ncbi:hypothetical protein [Methylobacterium sp. CM6257]
MSEKDFGRYLTTVGERNVDLLPMEEFQCDDEIVSWFCSLLERVIESFLSTQCGAAILD